MTTRVGNRPLALTVSAFCSVSLDPPQVLVCVDSRSETHSGFEHSRFFGVSILAEDQAEISRRFAMPGGEKFASQGLVEGEHVSFIPGALAHIECRVVAAYPGGDHVIYLGTVERVQVFSGRPLLYHEGGYGRVEEGEE